MGDMQEKAIGSDRHMVEGKVLVMRNRVHDRS